jgi:hypothetical protein
MKADEIVQCDHCDHCRSIRLASVTAKCSDLCTVHLTNYDHERHGYVPGDMGIGGDDYVCFVWCLDCGKIQPGEDARFPLPTCALEKVAKSP